jgi:hypothetical protein
MNSRKLGPAALLWVTILVVPAVALAGGTITGVVIDGFTGQPVRGATLSVEGTDISFPTGVGGDFRGEAPAGTYSVLVTKSGFEPQRVTDVVVAEGGNADFAVVILPLQGADAAPEMTADVSEEAVSDVIDGAGAPLAADEMVEGDLSAGDTQVAAASQPSDDVAADSGVFVGEITVEAAAAEESTEQALLVQRKQASQISDAISKQEMDKNAGGDAAGALQRVTGISVQNDKYVYVRGLGERYSNTTLNGSKLPTTEFDKKVVPLDLFPSKLLDNVKVSKTYSPDMSGDFAAGLVEIETLDFPNQRTLEISIGGKSNSNTTGDAFGQYVGGLSFSGSGGQSIPSSIPDDQFLARGTPFKPGFTPDELQQFGWDLIGAWTADNTAKNYVGSPYAGADPNLGFALTYGDTFGNLGVVISATRAHTYYHQDEEQSYYVLGAGDELQLTTDYDLATDDEGVRLGLVGNFNYKINQDHRLELRTIFTRDSKAQNRFFAGWDSDIASTITNYRVRYGSEEIASYQLGGEHFFSGLGAGGALLEWRGSIGDATNNSNLRETLYQNQGGVQVLTDESQSGLLLYNDLADDIVDGGVDWTQFFQSGNAYGSLKGGVAYYNRERDFSSRRFRFNFRNITGIDLTPIPDDIYIEENINPNGLEIKEETRSTDFYTANHDLGAAYVLGDVNLGKWRLYGGLRYEDSEIVVTTLQPFSPEATPFESIVTDQEFMPALSATYRLNANTNLRAAVSQTVNRPEFRELAPFEWTDVVGGRSARGNPDLVTARITSYDLRWEWFPDQFGVIAASVFYKDFTDPIERTLLFAVELQSTWINTPGATNLGAELEFRRDLGWIAQSLAPLSLQLNYTYVDSEISVGDDPIVTSTTRPLVGQPDHTANVVLEWAPPSWGTMVRVLYNYTGTTLYQAGGLGIPDVYQEPMDTLDLVWKQRLDFLARGLGLTVTASNLTNSQYELIGGFEQRYQRGRGLGLGISYTVF